MKCHQNHDLEITGKQIMENYADAKEQRDAEIAKNKELLVARDNSVMQVQAV